MPITRRSNDGRLMIGLANGTFREATPGEQAAHETPQLQAMLAQGPRIGASLLDLAGASSPAGQFLPPGAQQTLAQRVTARIAERSALFQPLDELRPDATLQGQLLFDPLNLLGFGLSAPRKAATRGLQRVGAASPLGLTPAGPDSAIAAPVVEALGEAAIRNGPDSVGAASILDFIPRPIRETVQRAMDEIFIPGELSAEQRRVLPLADDIGFQFLPGQRSGNTFTSEAAMQQPIIRDAFSFELQANRELGNLRAARAVGEEAGEEFGDTFLVEVADRLGDQYDELVGSLPRMDFGAESGLRQRLQTLLDEAPDALDLAPDDPAVADLQRMLARNLDELDGPTWQRMHSRWRQRATRARRAPDVERNETSALYHQMVDELNQAALDSGAPETALRQFRVLNEQYKVLKIFEKPGVLDLMSGNLNPRTAFRAFRTEFGRKQMFSREGRTVLPATGDLLDFLTVARRFKNNLGDSGTASRVGMADLANPKRLAGRIAIRELLKRRAP